MRFQTLGRHEAGLTRRPSDLYRLRNEEDFDYEALLRERLVVRCGVEVTFARSAEADSPASTCPRALAAPA
jgi:hypothetical protein